jgi:glycosyltransferase involved in cell wall biosynthesis
LPDNYKLIFIGKQSDELKNYIQNNSFEHIYFFDEVPHSELSSIYGYIDYGLILYKPIDLNFDNCAPNKLYEYWAHGVPVLAHNLKGLEGLIKEPMGTLVNLYNFNTNIFFNIKKLTDEQRNLIKKEFIQNFEVNKFQKELEQKLQNVLS